MGRGTAAPQWYRHNTTARRNRRRRRRRGRVRTQIAPPPAFPSPAPAFPIPCATARHPISPTLPAGERGPPQRRDWTLRKKMKGSRANTNNARGGGGEGAAPLLASLRDSAQKKNVRASTNVHGRVRSGATLSPTPARLRGAPARWDCGTRAARALARGDSHNHAPPTRAAGPYCTMALQQGHTAPLQ